MLTDLALALKRLRLLILAVIVTAACGCGTSYQIVPARLAILDVPHDEFPALVTTVRGLMVREGLEYLGKDQEMIAFIHSVTDESTMDADRMTLARLERERTFLSRHNHLRVVLMDYSDGVPHELPLDYSVPSDHFVELDVFDERPGGFGFNGLAVYNRLLRSLQASYGTRVHLVSPPPATNEAEYRRITWENNVAIGFQVTAAFVLPFLITGFISYRLLKARHFSAKLKSLVFALVNAWLVAPLPFPAASILVITAPHLFAFPWTDFDYYSRVSEYAVVSFPVSFAICALVGILLFNRRNAATSSSPAISDPRG